MTSRYCEVSCHAATTALLGWYLLMPPMDGREYDRRGDRLRALRRRRRHQLLSTEEPDAREVMELIKIERRIALPIAGDLRDEAFCRRLVEEAI
jgi:hypothetical protein